MNIEEQDAGMPEVIEVDESVLKDLESKFSGVACPVHGTAPSFEVGEDGSVVEHMCCEALRSIIRELQVNEGERPPGSGETVQIAGEDAGG